MTWQNPYNQMQHNLEGHHVGTWQTRYPQSHGRGAGFPQRHGTGNSGHELSNNPHTGRSVIVGASPGGFMAAPRSVPMEATHANIEDRLINMLQPIYQPRMSDIFRGNLSGLNVVTFMLAMQRPRDLTMDLSSREWRRQGFNDSTDWANKLQRHIWDIYGGGAATTRPSTPSTPQGGGGGGYKDRTRNLGG